MTAQLSGPFKNYEPTKEEKNLGYLFLKGKKKKQLAISQCPMH